MQLNDGKINLSESSGYHYTEYTSYAYTNCDLVSAMTKNLEPSYTRLENPKTPYTFYEYGTSFSLNGNDCVSITLPYGQTNSTELIYSDNEKQYTLLKNGNVKTDMLYDKACTYDNVFILFADSTTYETCDYTETVLETAGEGYGKYATLGKIIDITWRVNQGQLTFYDSEGNELIINRGTSYISYMKSSFIQKITIK